MVESFLNLQKYLAVGFHRRFFANIDAPRDKVTHVAWLRGADQSCHSFAYLFVYTDIPLCQRSGRDGLLDYLRDGINITSSLLRHSKFLLGSLVTSQMRGLIRQVTSSICTLQAFILFTSLLIGQFNERILKYEDFMCGLSFCITSINSGT